MDKKAQEIYDRFLNSEKSESDYNDFRTDLEQLILHISEMFNEMEQNEVNMATKVLVINPLLKMLTDGALVYVLKNDPKLAKNKNLL